MKIENIIRRVLREEQEEEKLLKIPGIRYFNNDWNILQKFLESQGYPRYSIGGDLDLRDSDVKSLGNLVRVEGDLDLYYSDVESLGDLEYVGGDLNLIDTDIETLGKLERVEGFLTLESCQNLESLGDLEYVGKWLDIKHTNVESLGNLKYVGSHLFLRYTPLSEKYTGKQIRKIVEVVGGVYL
jgi:hypothetical protein